MAEQVRVQAQHQQKETDANLHKGFGLNSAGKCFHCPAELKKRYLSIVIASIVRKLGGMDYHLTRYVKLGRGDFIRANYDEYGNTPEIKKYSMSQSVQQIFVFEYLLFNGFILLQPKKQQNTIQSLWSAALEVVPLQRLNRWNNFIQC